MGICSSVTAKPGPAPNKGNDKQNINSKSYSKTITNIDDVRATGTRSNRQIDNEKEIVINNNMIVSKAIGSPLDYYSRNKKLGEGAYGVVWKVQHYQTGLDRAMKKIIKNSKTKKETETEILNEIEILKKLDHPNIVKIFEFYNTPDGYYLITEYCQGGELFNEITSKGVFSESVAASLMYQLLSAVNYCHTMGVIHRDLKPENILIDSKDENGNYSVKVIDFGTAKIYEKNKSEKKVIGSSYYIAPEVLYKNYNEKCDLWSCGVIMYILLSGRAPFSGDKDSIILEKIKIGQYDLKDKPWPKISSEAKDLIKKLLEMKPNKRISAGEALKQKWFKKQNVKTHFSEANIEGLKQCVENIKKYNPEFKLQQIVIAYLVHNIPQLEGVKEACKIFNLLNDKNDGKMTPEQLSTGFKKHLGMKNPDQIVNEIFIKIDNDHNGYIEYAEFVRASIDKEIFLNDEILKFAFSFFDKDGSGEITVEELRAVLCTDADGDISLKLLKKILQEIDEDGNEQISYDEFKTMMQKILN